MIIKFLVAIFPLVTTTALGQPLEVTGIEGVRPEAGRHGEHHAGAHRSLVSHRSG